MEKRQQQRVVESGLPHASHARSQQEAGSVRLYAVIAVLILALLILLGMTLGFLSIVDAIRGHPLASWHAFWSWVDAIKWWVAAGILLFVAYRVHKDRAHTALERATARHVKEETKRRRDIRYHNESHMPEGYIDLSDELGNYGQVVSGSRVVYVLPGNAPAGNAGINPKHLLDFMERTNTVDTDYYEEEQPEQIALPEASIHITEDYRVPADDLLSGRKLIVGLSGSGKSNTVGAYGEELGQLEAPLVLADTENEYEPLCDPRWFPRGELADARSVTPDNAYQFGGYVLQELKQVILNLQSYEMEEAALVMIGIVQGMRDWQEERDVRIPSEFILEEAVTWLPQNIKESPLYGSDTFNTLQGTFFNDMVRKGRKRGLGLTVVCQKIAEIDKRALQADAKILHFQSEGPDLQIYAKMGIAREETLSLQRGDAFLFTGHVSKRRVHIRKRYSEHGANTPGLDNLRAFQRTRNLPENIGSLWGNYGEISERQATGAKNLEEPVETFRNISSFRQPEKASVNNPYDGIPENLVKQIEEAYVRRGCKYRTEIRDELQLNGDQYWMVKAVCNEYDKKMRGGA